MKFVIYLYASLSVLIIGVCLQAVLEDKVEQVEKDQRIEKFVERFKLTDVSEEEMNAFCLEVFGDIPDPD